MVEIRTGNRIYIYTQINDLSIPDDYWELSISDEVIPIDPAFLSIGVSGALSIYESDRTPKSIEHLHFYIIGANDETVAISRFTELHLGQSRPSGSAILVHFECTNVQLSTTTNIFLPYFTSQLRLYHLGEGFYWTDELGYLWTQDDLRGWVYSFTDGWLYPLESTFSFSSSLGWIYSHDRGWQTIVLL